MDHVDIFYNKKHYYVTTKDILSLNSLSDVIKRFKTFGWQK